MSAQPGDGAAIILHLIEAAREFRSQAGKDLSAVEYWVGELERMVEECAPVLAEAGWEARTWGELVEGDTVSAGGEEAVVEWTQVQGWHTDPRSSQYRPVAMERSVTQVRLRGRDRVYPMPSGGEVETLRGPAGSAIDEVNGRRAGMVEADRVMVLGSWAADAYETLAAAGLEPEPIVMTQGERV